MEVVNPRSALLSNYEVLELLHELENDHLARTKTALRIKKEEEASGQPHSSFSAGGNDPTVVEISENLRTVQVEAIQWLSGDFQPMAKQTPAGITQLVKDLASYDLTKAEKLQIVNLAPTQQVDLYVIVEELEDRLGESQEDVLQHVQSSLTVDASTRLATSLEGSEADAPGEIIYDNNEWGEEAAVVNDLEFDDTGEGRGVEGDLDMEDD